MNLGGLTLADNVALDGAYALPAIDLSSHAFVVVVADEDGPTGGDVPHTTPGLGLTALDAVVVLADRCGTTWRTLELSTSTPADTAFGLLPDGDDTASGQDLTTPTPGAANQ